MFGVFLLFLYFRLEPRCPVDQTPINKDAVSCTVLVDV